MENEENCIREMSTYHIMFTVHDIAQSHFTLVKEIGIGLINNSISNLTKES
jgi:hypothetical protein